MPNCGAALRYSLPPVRYGVGGFEVASRAAYGATLVPAVPKLAQASEVFASLIAFLPELVGPAVYAGIGVKQR